MKPLAVAASLIVLSISTVLWAQSQSGTTWRTNNDDIVVSGITSFEVTGDADGIDADFKGKPLIGTSRSQQMEFRTNSLVGRFIQDSAKKYYVENAVLEGGVQITRKKAGENQVLTTQRVVMKEGGSTKNATFTLPGSFTLTEGKSVLKANSGVANFVPNSAGLREFSSIRFSGGYTFHGEQVRDGQNEQIDVKGDAGVLDSLRAGGTFTSSNTLNFEYRGTRKDGQSSVPVSLDFTSAGGTLVLPPNSSGYPLKSADIKGPITLDLVTISAPNSKGQQIPTTIKATGDRLRFNGGILSLTGNVKINIDQGQSMSLNGETLQITLSQDMKVKKWSISGGPAEIKVKPDGGGR